MTDRTPDRRVADAQLNVRGRLIRIASLDLPGRFIWVLGYSIPVVATLLFWLVHVPNFAHVTPATYQSLTIDYRPQVEALVVGSRPFSTRYPPGFSLLLAGVYEFADWSGVSLPAASAASILLFTGGTGALLFHLARQLWGRRVALLLVVVWSTYPLGLWLTSYPSPETPFMAVLLGAIVAYHRAATADNFGARSFALSGALVGLAMLIRPIAIGVGLVLAVILLGQRRFSRQLRLRGAALLLLGNLVVVAPWEAWMFGRSARLLPLSSGGVAGILDGLTYAVDPTEMRPVHVSPDVAALQRDIYARQYRDLNSVTSIARYLRQAAAVRPVALSKLIAAKAARSWYGTDSGEHEGVSLAIQIIYVPLLLLGLVGSYLSGGLLRSWAVTAAALTIYFWAMTVTSLSIVRYMVPAVVLLVIAAPGMRHFAHPLIGRRDKARRVPPAHLQPTYPAPPS